MLNRSANLCFGSIPALLRRFFPTSGPGFFLVSVVLLTFGLQSACMFRKGKAPKPAPATVRLVLLPFNVPEEDRDLKWAALAAPIMMAIASERARDLEIVPLWQTMPVAVEEAKASRIFNEESAAVVASWFSAKWSAMGELTPSKRGVSMIVDFIPAKSNLVAFRYGKTGRLDSVGSHFPDAFRQFLYYLALRPLLQARQKEQSFSSLRNLAEALDREYGWFVDAQPGKSQQLISNLASSDMRLARLLFSPDLYPVLAPAKKD